VVAFEDWQALVVSIVIRALRIEDAAVTQEVERRAGAAFRDVGLPEIAEHEPYTTEELEEYIGAGRAWAAVVDDRVVGAVLAEVVDGNAHVEEVAVHPDHQGRGAGRALLDRVRQWAIDTHRPAVTLTTFADVPWNRPLYEHLGFVVLREDEIGPELAAVRAHEATLGLDPSIRVCMRLRL
jgi:GNAT superfamily N-acetyltransferase